jgi:hypothetical protein
MPITLSEERVVRLLIGRHVEISVGEPWDFESPDGQNALRGRITGVAATEAVEDQGVALEVTPFPAKGGTTVDRLVARARYEDEKGIIERLASGEDAEVNLDYGEQAPEGTLPEGSSPFLIGSVRLAD